MAEIQQKAWLLGHLVFGEIHQALDLMKPWKPTSQQSQALNATHQPHPGINGRTPGQISGWYPRQHRNQLNLKHAKLASTLHGRVEEARGFSELFLNLSLEHFPCQEAESESTMKNLNKTPLSWPMSVIAFGPLGWWHCFLVQHSYHGTNNKTCTQNNQMTKKICNNIESCTITPQAMHTLHTKHVRGILAADPYCKYWVLLIHFDLAF